MRKQVYVLKQIGKLYKRGLCMFILCKITPGAWEEVHLGYMRHLELMKNEFEKVKSDYDKSRGIEDR